MVLLIKVISPFIPDLKSTHSGIQFWGESLLANYFVHFLDFLIQNFELLLYLSCLNAPKGSSLFMQQSQKIQSSLLEFVYLFTSNTLTVENSKSTCFLGLTPSAFYYIGKFNVNLFFGTNTLNFPLNSACMV